MAIDYVEFPTDVITKITWPQKPLPPDPDASTIYGPPMCNVYGHSMVRTPVNAVSGPNDYAAPWIGVFKTHELNGPPDKPWGALQGGSSAVEEMTAAPQNLHAFNIVLTQTNLTFQNGQIYVLPDDFGNYYSATWEVPMAAGAVGTVSHPQFLFAPTYQLDVSYESAFDGIFGIAVTHPGSDGALVPPVYPDFIFGGSGSYSCTIDVPTPTLANPIGASNVFWMTSRGGDTWTFADPSFMANTLTIAGNFYEWTFTANCVAREPGS